ncbi:MAG TPA: hypothetical protein VIA06_02860 [Candidatus Dormibacteraeota bacterium]|jgi:hypothetical protein|nr:hypothetical protein [Candidatus Dormibacteraeota bacterium]
MRWGTAKFRTQLACVVALILAAGCGSPGPVQIVGTGVGVALYGTIVIGVATIRNPSNDLTAVSIRLRLSALAPGSGRSVGSVGITVPALGADQETTVAVPVAFLEGNRAARVVASVTGVRAWVRQTRRPPRLEASDIRIQDPHADGTLTVSGRLTSTGERAMPPVQVFAVCYGRRGTVLGGGRGWTEGGMPAGGTDPVSIPSYVGRTPAYCRLFATPPGG